MKRPVLSAAIAMVSGILTAHFIENYIITFILIGILFLAAFYMSGKLKYNLVLILVILAVYSFGALEYHYFKSVNESRFEKFSGQKVKVRGYVIQEPEIKEERVIYRIETDEIVLENPSMPGEMLPENSRKTSSANRVKGRILLTVLRRSDDLIYDYGQAIEVTGEISLPKERRNPGGFDYKRYLFQSGVSATMFVRNDYIASIPGDKKNLLLYLGNIIRRKTVQIIEKSLPREQAALLSGMLIGYRSGLSKEIQEAFSDSGLIHIMAVSGAQVAFLIIPLNFLFKRLKLGRKKTNLIIIGVLVIFSSVTGFQPSVSRAVIMASIVLLSQIVLREPDIYTSISIAAIILLAINPFTLFNVGFQLSFVATVSLVMFHKNISGFLRCKYIPSGVINNLSMIISAQVGVLPVTAYYFNKVSLVSIISNLIATPLVQLASILGYIMVIVGLVSAELSKLIGYINNIFLSLVLIITKTLAGLPCSTITILTPNLAAVVLYYIIIWFIIYYKPFIKFKNSISYGIISIALAILLCLLVISSKRGLEVVFLDVGNGDSALVKTEKGMAILIDGGGYYNTDGEKNIGDSVIIPFLLSYGIGKLDIVIATHGHEDHIQGLKPVLESFNVGAFIIPDLDRMDEFKELLDVCLTRNIKVIKCSRGDVIRIDEKTRMEVVNPSDNFNPLIASLNNSSLVLKLSHMDVDFLFTGDIEKEAEADILESGFNLESEVLKVAHHGSSTSTTQQFLEKVKPVAAVISVGKNNFGHPSGDVLKRLENNGAAVYRTDIHGAIVVKSDGRKIKIKKTVS